MPYGNLCLCLEASTAELVEGRPAPGFLFYGMSSVYSEDLRVLYISSPDVLKTQVVNSL
jgi:hypothetical protein